MTDYGDVLAGGKWVTDGLIRRWVPDEPAPPALACNRCGATLAEPCRTAAGKAVSPHAERIMRCLCGANVEPGRTYCDDCKDVARRMAWRDGKRRKVRATKTCCPCGTQLPSARSAFCSDDCRIEARRASWRTYGQKRRTA